MVLCLVLPDPGRQHIKWQPAGIIRYGTRTMVKLGCPVAVLRLLKIHLMYLRSTQQCADCRYICSHIGHLRGKVVKVGQMWFRFSLGSLGSVWSGVCHCWVCIFVVSGTCSSSMPLISCRVGWYLCGRETGGHDLPCLKCP